MIPFNSFPSFPLAFWYPLKDYWLSPFVLTSHPLFPSWHPLKPLPLFPPQPAKIRKKGERSTLMQSLFDRSPSYLLIPNPSLSNCWEKEIKEKMVTFGLGFVTYAIPFYPFLSFSSHLPLPPLVALPPISPLLSSYPKSLILNTSPSTLSSYSFSSLSLAIYSSSLALSYGLKIPQIHRSSRSCFSLPYMTFSERPCIAWIFNCYHKIFIVYPQV